ncbi:MULTISPECIES: nuclease-related domain-containing DEAD/DEAH box helicase [unclassified Nocardioides]|uniref:nuclease-related domain-containing DEAD/DEAH box helicase n=1 Tax=unclassified Nocardioides TaxID=2615069 RepID=UPI000702F3B0|nr:MULTISPECIES: NERD domain-containing protein [unclassified Nocardioides]KQZ67142.1 nuclease [Nocardioides sp. Root151]KRF12791.1 nuclease [Nocardioides sp. Soil796]
MVRLIPESPVFTTTSEQQVWELLRDTLGDDDVLVANRRLTDETKDHEIDLLVLMPDLGALVLEIKGGSVWREDDKWWITRRGRTAEIHPVDQARGSKYSLRTYVERDPRWGSRQRIAWAHGVITPYTDIELDAEVPDLPHWALHGKAAMETLVERLRINARDMQHGQRPPTYDDIEAIVDILNGRLPTSYDVNADAEDRAATVDRLTQEQASILQVTRLLKRVEVRGGAGSGKTVLALQQAKQLTRGRGDRKAQRVAVLCYSLGLAEHLKREVSTWNRKERPAFVGTFHDFGKQWGAPEGDRTNSDFWEVDLPQLMGDLAEGLDDGAKFDAIIVDEAQDFADTWWRPVLKALRDEEEGGLYVYSDENQRIFARFGRPPVQLVPLVLDHNLRNTRQIHDSFGPLAPSRMYASGGDGPDVRFVAASADDSIGTADDVVDQMLDEGWKPANIMLLTTGKRHPIQVERTDFHDQDGYWRSFWDPDEVFYGHVLGCKGLERKAVVLCVNEPEVRERARERLYVGMSRATDALVVVGDPAVIREVGGDAVARRLGVQLV